MSKEKKKLIPTLRFPDFMNNEPWEVKVIDEVVNYENGKAHEQDIKHNGKFIVVNSKFISTDGSVKKYTDKALCLAKKGEILMVLSDIPNGKAISKCFLVEKDNLYSVNQRICKLTPTKADAYFLFCLINRNKYLLAYDDGIKQTNLKNEDVLGCPLLLPKDEKEQQKIAACLSSLNEIIVAHSKKLATLKDYKKGLMQNLFPREGEKVPRLRFKEFEGDGKWIEKSIGDFAPLQRGFDLPVDDIVIGQYPVVFSNGILKHHNEFKVKAPGIVTGRSGTIGKVSYLKQDFWPHNTSLWVTDFNDNFPLFVYHYFVFIGLERFAAGGGVPTLNRNDVHRHNILIPNTLEEQIKVAELILSIEDLIEIQSTIIQQLKFHKKGLMQGLFPKIN